MQTIEAFVSHGSAMLAGVAALMLDILAKLHCGGDGSSEDVAPTSLLLLGPPGVGLLLFKLLIVVHPQPGGSKII